MREDVAAELAERLCGRCGGAAHVDVARLHPDVRRGVAERVGTEVREDAGRGAERDGRGRRAVAVPEEDHQAEHDHREEHQVAAHRDPRARTAHPRLAHAAHHTHRERSTRVNPSQKNRKTQKKKKWQKSDCPETMKKPFITLHHPLRPHHRHLRPHPLHPQRRPRFHCLHHDGWGFPWPSARRWSACGRACAPRCRPPPR